MVNKAMCSKYKKKLKKFFLEKLVRSRAPVQLRGNIGRDPHFEITLMVLR